MWDNTGDDAPGPLYYPVCAPAEAPRPWSGDEPFDPQQPSMAGRRRSRTGGTEEVPLTVSQASGRIGRPGGDQGLPFRYSRGVDRCDEDMLRSVYWEDAVDDHAIFTGTREELIIWVMPLLRSMESRSTRSATS